jgi:uncharacterized membrane protein
VIAIIITIMVLEMKVPHSAGGHNSPNTGADLTTLRHLMPVFLSYVLSFIYIGIYWNNHHHMLHVVKHVNGRIMWANHHLLFWLSLVPFVTHWVGANHNAPVPTALYGFVLLMSGLAFVILQQQIVRSHSDNRELVNAIGADFKGKISLLSYSLAIGIAFVNQWISDAIFVAVAILWLVPDRRFARAAVEG